MTLLMALLLTLAGTEPDDVPPLADVALPRSLALEEQDSRPGYQDPRPLGYQADPGSSKQATPKFLLSLAIEGRWTTPFGAANRDVYAVDNPNGGIPLLFDSHLRWNDVFSNGWGTSLIGEVTLMQAGRGGGEGRGRGKFSAGAYVSFSQDHFSGDNVDDGRGNSFSVDNLTMNTYLVGGTMYQSLGEVAFMSGRLGLGAVHYAQVDADYSFQFSPAFRGGFLKDTWNFAMEFQGGTGYRFGAVAFTLGVGVRLLLPPDQASTVSLDSGTLFTIDITLGIEIGF